MNCIFHQSIYHLFYLWLSNIKRHGEDLEGFHKKANARMMENIICKEKVEELGIFYLKGLDRFNNCPQTYKRLCFNRMTSRHQETTENNCLKSLRELKKWTQHLLPLSITITKSLELKVFYCFQNSLENSKDSGKNIYKKRIKDCR